MIDYLRCRVPIRLPKPIDDGCTMKFDRTGTRLSATPHRLKVLGSHEAALHVRSVSNSELEIDGNPVKWLQGHNLYGTDDLPLLLWSTLEKLLGELGTSLLECGIRSICDLDQTVITRVDVTQMLQLESVGDVQSYIRAAYENGSANRRGRGVLRGSTLIFGDAAGKNFTRWQIVIYSKGQEIIAHPLPAFMMADPDVMSWVNKALRVEVRYGRLELEKQNMRFLSGWRNPASSATVDSIGLASGTKVMDMNAMWQSKVDKLDFNSCSEQHFDLESLPRPLRATYATWRAGVDPRTILSRATFFRYRRQLMELVSVDISVPLPVVPTATIIPIKRVLEARPCGRPDWADRIDRELQTSGSIILSSAA